MSFIAVTLWGCYGAVERCLGRIAWLHAACCVVVGVTRLA